MNFRFTKVWLTCLLFLLVSDSLNYSFAEKVRVELTPEWDSKALVINREIAGTSVNGLSVSRFDGLLSRLALQKADGTWLESDRWHVFFSAEKRRLTAVADGLPPVEFKAIRFLVGLDGQTDRTDPEQWPAEHPLNPEVCGLHWGWQSGYVFLALEGHWEPKPGTISGFSYHLAGAEKPMWVELPVKFSGANPATICLGVDIGSLLEGGGTLQKGTSTHSRAGDELAVALKDRVSRAFRVISVRSDIYQINSAEVATKSEWKFGTPVELSVSERLPKVKLPKDNPLTAEGIELGRRLFNDPRLSRGNAQSCASCHDAAKAFSDENRFSRGAAGETGRRNAMSLVNLAWAQEFFWDGRAKTLREQVLAPIQDSHEMNERLENVVAKLSADNRYSGEFKAAFGSSEISADRLALSLEQYLLTLVSQDSKFDRAARKLTKLSAQEQRGLELFITENDPARGLRGADCFHCHGGNLFTNHQFTNNGLEEEEDLGRMEVTGLETDRGKFKVPTLRNIARTAPYMHDGRFATLEEVIDHYNGKLHRSKTLDPNLAKHPDSGLGLSAEDKEALIAFLKTLTDENFVSSRSATDPSQRQLSQSSYHYVHSN